jgi:hypothetical protein
MRFLASGLAFFAVVIVLAAVPVPAQGSPSAPCTGGNDIVRGGYGADIIYGDVGRDYLYGGPGNDRVYALDSERDHLFGGRGYEKARMGMPLDVFSSIESHWRLDAARSSRAQ